MVKNNDNNTQITKPITISLQKYMDPQFFAKYKKLVEDNNKGAKVEYDQNQETVIISGLKLDDENRLIIKVKNSSDKDVIQEFTTYFAVYKDRPFDRADGRGLVYISTIPHYAYSESKDQRLEKIRLERQKSEEAHKAKKDQSANSGVAPAQASEPVDNRAQGFADRYMQAPGLIILSNNQQASIHEQELHSRAADPEQIVQPPKLEPEPVVQSPKPTQILEQVAPVQLLVPQTASVLTQQLPQKPQSSAKPKIESFLERYNKATDMKEKAAINQEYCKSFKPSITQNSELEKFLKHPKALEYIASHRDQMPPEALLDIDVTKCDLVIMERCAELAKKLETKEELRDYSRLSPEQKTVKLVASILPIIGSAVNRLMEVYNEHQKTKLAQEFGDIDFGKLNKELKTLSPNVKSQTADKSVQSQAAVAGQGLKKHSAKIELVEDKKLRDQEEARRNLKTKIKGIFHRK